MHIVLLICWLCYAVAILTNQVPDFTPPPSFPYKSKFPDPASVHAFNSQPRQNRLGRTQYEETVDILNGGQLTPTDDIAIDVEVLRGDPNDDSSNVGTNSPVHNLPDVGTNNPFEYSPYDGTNKPVHGLPDAGTNSPIDNLPDVGPNSPIDTLPDAGTKNPVDNLPFPEVGTTNFPVDDMSDVSMGDKKVFFDNVLHGLAGTDCNTPTASTAMFDPNVYSRGMLDFNKYFENVGAELNRPDDFEIVMLVLATRHFLPALQRCPHPRIETTNLIKKLNSIEGLQKLAESLKKRTTLLDDFEQEIKHALGNFHQRNFVEAGQQLGQVLLQLISLGS